MPKRLWGLYEFSLGGFFEINLQEPIKYETKRSYWVTNVDYFSIFLPENLILTYGFDTAYKAISLQTKISGHVMKNPKTDSAVP